MIRVTVAVGNRVIRAGMTAATATAPGGMWNRGDTVESMREPKIIPSRAYEKINRIAAAWIASAQEMKAITTMVKATLAPLWPSEAFMTAMIGFAFFPLITSPKLGTARMYESVMKNAVAAPTSSVIIMARGIFRLGSLTSSATSPQASKP